MESQWGSGHQAESERHSQKLLVAWLPATHREPSNKWLQRAKKHLNWCKRSKGWRWGTVCQENSMIVAAEHMDKVRSFSQKTWADLEKADPCHIQFFIQSVYNSPSYQWKEGRKMQRWWGTVGDRWCAKGLHWDRERAIVGKFLCWADSLGNVRTHKKKPSGQRLQIKTSEVL